MAKRISALTGAAMAVGLMMSGGAAAQTQCGASYAVKPGDTLYQITQQCRVTMSRIMNLNPSLGNPRDIEVGTEIRLAATEGQQREPSPRGPQGDTYRVEQGDTMYSIAQAFGLSVIEMLEANSQLDPFDIEVGQVIELPGDQPAASVQVRPTSGEPGQPVTVRADGLRPNDWVTIGAGPQASEWEEIESVQVSDDGEIAAEVRVPSWAEPGDNLIFVVDTDRGMTFKSGVFNVAARDGGGEGGDGRTLEGRVSQGTECHTLETPDGDVWSLVSDQVEFTSGEYVEVTGQRAEASFCMQGVGTLQVSSIEEVSPPDE
ncbi:LysM peptidoglycan-binding domain-containing protein [Chelativorans sp. YIM 93263]|uniref:LysM peptidoglycan-binding domain-containing protein n=1 Tax=Chelativorans sp. YIM 93263 TaxID=2906648 RepID=UPI002378C51E|nr:LysM peptidoglycan-binding domain-containing protein [Chelativorans sp. YIM 93263]